MQFASVLNFLIKKKTLEPRSLIMRKLLLKIDLHDYYCNIYGGI